MKRLNLLLLILAYLAFQSCGAFLQGLLMGMASYPYGGYYPSYGGAYYGDTSTSAYSAGMPMFSSDASVNAAIIAAEGDRRRAEQGIYLNSDSSSSSGGSGNSEHSCGTCSGTGTCIVCKGAGRLSRTLGGSNGGYTTECSSCNGTGKCQLCSGTGRSTKMYNY